MTNVSSQRLRVAAVAAVVALALILTAGLSMAATVSASSTATAAATPRESIVTPGEVDSVVASDTAINNRANASLSIPLQNSHETCLQQILDDATYRGDQAADSDTIGGSFDQVPSRALVPHEDSYPAVFSVLAEDRASSQPTTNNLLTYVKTSASARWKLASSSEILGPTDAGVTVPAVASDAAGYATSLDPVATDGLVSAPDKVAARVASAFTSEATSGKLPAGISAQFGPKDVANPHTIAASYATVGTVTTKFSATTPSAAAADAPSQDCPDPAYRLADGGALVTFAIFQQIVVHVRTGNVVVQPADRSALGVLLSPGSYSSITMVSGDMGLAIVPPAGSRSPIEVIGQASEGLSETGVPGSGSAINSAPGAPADASSIAKGVDSRLVDINLTLGYEQERAAGTGMVLTPNGEVLTNNHVIEEATSISVTDLGNGKTYAAKVVGYDRTSDVAVVQLEDASGLETVRLGNSAKVRTGEAVVGIGNAGGSGGVPSDAGGAVTALNRSITASDEGDGTSELLTGLIETDAGIEPGDSGGPLVTTNGRVIGMDTAASAGFEFQSADSLANEAFSIPIDKAISIARQIEAGRHSGAVHIGPTAFLGVELTSSRTSQAATSGAEVAGVISGFPAARAGLAEGDTITSLDGERVTTTNSLTTIIESKRPGTSTRLVYVGTNGLQHPVTLRLASGPPQ